MHDNLDIQVSDLPTYVATFTFLREGGLTLMMHRNKRPDDFLYGKFLPPGGKIRMNESPNECAQREFFEETNLRLGLPLNYLGKVFFNNSKRNFQGRPATFHYLVHIFEATSYSGSLDTKKDPKGTPVWVPNARLKTLPIERGDHLLLDLFEAGLKINHHIVLTDESFTSYDLTDALITRLKLVYVTD